MANKKISDLTASTGVQLTTLFEAEKITPNTSEKVTGQQIVDLTNANLPTTILYSVVVGNSVFVSVTGNDSTGLRNRLDKPFATPAAAMQAAFSGDTVFVYPGTYSGAGFIGKPGVNWHLYNGAILTQCMFTDVDNGPMTCTLSGEGEISNSGSALYMSYPSSNITVKGVTLRSEAAWTVDASCPVYFNNVKVINSGGPGFNMQNGDGYTFDNVKIITAPNPAIQALGGFTNIKIYSAYANALNDGSVTNIISGTALIFDADIV